MASGRKEKIMIACVTFETVKVAYPAEYYEANRVHLIHYLKGDANPVYGAFYERTCEIISEKLPKATIIEHSEKKVYVFSDMLTEILRIIDGENARFGGECDIYINISAGSPEYSAAAAIASMMYGNVTAFSVPVKKYTVSAEDIPNIYFRDEKPLGMAEDIREPTMIPSYSMPMPDENLVRALRIFRKLSENGKKKVTSSMIVGELEKAGIWIHPSTGKAKAQSDAVNYHRDFVKKWEALGWIAKDAGGTRYAVTEEGEMIMSIFYNVDRTSSAESDRQI